MLNVKLNKPLGGGNLATKLKLWAPIISAVWNLQFLTENCISRLFLSHEDKEVKDNVGETKLQLTNQF